MKRCPWCMINDRETKYHDNEWGVPIHNDIKQFEYLMLEVMQCGLSWDTVLKKREIFRGCFDGFDFDKIAAYTERDIERILSTEGVIRSRRKIEAVVNNARCFQRIREEFGSFSEYLWGWTGGKTLLYKGHELGDIPASNPLSERIGKDLKKRGMKYLGGVTVYSHLQACGIINDHLRDCHCYKKLIKQYPVRTVTPDNYSTHSFEAEYTYTGNDLGAAWTAEKTVFRVWAPTATAVQVNLYKSGDPEESDLIERLPMTADVNGTWTAEKSCNLKGVYYTYSVTVNGQIKEACDPYAKTTGVNGVRAMVIDLAATNPEGWENDRNPNAHLTYNDMIIYELHLRDLSSDPSSGIANKGKFLALTEKIIDHIKELGVTHLHLLPIYDFGSVDESKPEQYNWGYDPLNYNVPEGSYSTDPYHGEVRVKELKQMVQALHSNGISVVMDVVYNHVHSAEDFCFNRIVPDYFSRTDDCGVYSNGSGCGNDTASERSMVRKYIVDSVKYWAEEYHIDGFRFDLAGLLDIGTVNQVVEEVRRLRPDVVFYGEGWAMPSNVTKPNILMATQANSAKTPAFAYFNDTFRDALKGSVFDKSPGYVSGATGQADTIRNVFRGITSWCKSPAQTVNYASCHDNNTLFDRIALSVPNASREDMIKMNNLAAAIYLTAQGIPFMQAGEEMLRTKQNPDGSFNANSYNAPDEVNSIKWHTLEQEEYRRVFEYYKGLIAFRKAHPALRLTNAEEVKKAVSSVKGLADNVVAFRIKGGVNGERAKELFIVFNPNKAAQEIELPKGVWEVFIQGGVAGTKALDVVTNGKVTVEGISATVLVKG